MRSYFILLLAISGVAHAACTCPAAEKKSRCTSAQLAQTEKQNLQALQYAFSALDRRPGAKQNVRLAVDTELDLKQLYQESRRQYGDKALSAALGMPLAKVTERSFTELNFAQKLNHAAGVLHPAGPAFVLKWKDESQQMTLGGTKVPTTVFIPDRQPSRYVPLSQGAGCWEKLDDPLRLSANGTQVQGAFGNDFPEVGRIIRVDTNKKITLDRTCAFVMLSPSWAVTALHCVAEQRVANGDWQIAKFRKSEESGTWSGERTLFLGQQEVGDSLPAACIGLPGRAPCPWTTLEVEKVEAFDLQSDSKHPRLPKHDIALVKLSRAVDSDIGFPTINKDPQGSGTVTLVAFGLATPPFNTLLDLQVGWNRAGTTSDGGSKFTWNPSKNTGQSSICPGDSGGALFVGFENGGCSCNGEKPRVRNLAGIVSFVSLPSGFSDLQTPTKLQRCIDSDLAGAVQTSTYRSWICQNVPEALGCK
ncbi:trypsin-like serine protease [Hydrogenophaga sp.]|uniref:trypsin-like serine protease n=1 Tax=Hydrogenophaga sp. TaxID=1904254 RepID=UPI003F7187F6